MLAGICRKAAVGLSALVLVAVLVGQTLSSAGRATVPRVVRLSGTFIPANGLPAGAVEGVTLGIYREQQGGTPLWEETQNVYMDAGGHYTVLLGAAQEEGVPAELFSSGEPRWLSVRLERPGETEQARVLLTSVPYALKAADAETLGGLPASAYLRVTPEGTAGSAAGSAGVEAGGKALRPRVTSGTANCIGVFVNTTDLGCSGIWQVGGNVGVGTTTPPFPLTIGGTLGSTSNAIGIPNNSAYGGFDSAGTQRVFFWMDNNNPDVVHVRNNQRGAGGTISLDSQPGGVASLTILNNGNVGIGTVAPGAKLEVMGPLKVSGAGSALVFPDGTRQTTASGALERGAIAQLRWYSANLVTTFPTGTAPVGAAFDGSNIWVANNGDNTVSKLRASDGYNLGTYAAGGTGPRWLAFDGSNIWVANYGSNTVAKLSASSGSVTGTFGVGANPAGLVFDGGNIWAVNYGSNTVTKLRATDGMNLATFVVGSNPTAAAFDGSNIWVVNSGSNTVTQLRASDGSTMGTFNTGTMPRGIAFDGADMWVTNYGASTVTELLASNGSSLGTFSVGLNPSGVLFDGANIWVANSGGNNVTKLRASDGSSQGVFAVGYAPNGLAFDGVNVWVANAASNTINKL